MRAAPDEERTRPGTAAWVRVIERAFLGTLILAPLALGGANPLAQTGIAALLLLFGLPLLWVPGPARPPRLHPLAIALLLAALWTLFRASPLSAPFASAWAAEAYGLWPGLDLRASLAPGHASLSALRLIALATVVQVALARFGDRAGLRRVGIAVLGAAGIVALVGLVQVLRSADAILFFYSPRHISRIIPLAGPFVNPNQAGSFLCLGGALLLGAAAGGRGTARAFALSTFAFLAGFAAWHLGAFGAWGSLLLCALFALVARAAQALPSRSLRRTLPVLLAGLVLAGLALTLHLLLPSWLAGQEGPLVRIFSKSAYWHAALALVPEAPLVGFGPMAFADIYPHVAPPGTDHRHSYAESLPIQLTVDHGLPVALLLLTAALLPLAGLARDGNPTRRSLRLRILVVAVYVGAEATTGMGHQSLAYAAAALALFGSASGLGMRQRDNGSAPGQGAAREGDLPATSGRAARRAVPAFAVAIVLTLLPVLPGLPTSVDLILHDRKVPLADLLSRTPPALDEALEEARRRAALQPAEPELIAQTALVHLRLGEQERAIELIDYLDRRASTHPWTASLQRRLALRTADVERACRAFELEWALRQRIDSALVPLLVADPGEGLGCLPLEDAILHALFRALDERGDALERVALAEHLLHVGGDDETVLREALSAMLSLDMPEGARLYTNRLAALDTRSAQTVLQMIEADLALQDPETALTRLEDALAGGTSSMELIHRQSELLFRLRGRDAALSALETHDPRLLVDGRTQAAYWLLHAELLMGAERWNEAISSLERTLLLVPNHTRATRLLRRARAETTPSER